jgi:hypothetical protein
MGLYPTCNILYGISSHLTTYCGLRIKKRFAEPCRALFCVVLVEKICLITLAKQKVLV